VSWLVDLIRGVANKVEAKGEWPKFKGGDCYTFSCQRALLTNTSSLDSLSEVDDSLRKSLRHSVSNAVSDTKNVSIHRRISVDKMCYGLARFGRQKVR